MLPVVFLCVCNGRNVRTIAVKLSWFLSETYVDIVCLSQSHLQ